MHAAQKLAAAFFSAALLCSTSMALADKGGPHGNPHGGPPGQSGAHGSDGSHGDSQHGGIGPFGSDKDHNGIGPFGSDKDKDKGNKSDGTSGASRDGNGMQNRDVRLDEIKGDVTKIQGASVDVKSSDGRTQTYDVDGPVLAALKSHEGQKGLVFFSTDGKRLSGVSAIGERTNMRVMSRRGNTFLMQGADGETRLIALDARSINRLHIKVGSNLQLTTRDVHSERVVALDLVKAHAFDKFSARGRKLDRDVAKAKKSDIDVAKAKKSDVDVARAKKSDVDKAKKPDADESKVASRSKGKCGEGSGRNGNPAYANQMAKDAANDASGHNPPGLPHECVNPAGHTRGFCKGGSSGVDCSGVSAGGESVAMDQDTIRTKTKMETDRSDNVVANRGKCGESKSRNGNPAYANQMAKDAANDASGHNPPGLPHECVNPAGHTRGFCKGGSSVADCSGVSAGGEAVAADTESVHTHKAKKNVDTDVASNGRNGRCGESSKSGRRGNPAYANQMAKDAANDASGHNPPGLPHECVNPAGHTRGFCKGGQSESIASCGAGVAGAAVASAGSFVPARSNAPGNGFAAAPPARGGATAPHMGNGSVGPRPGNGSMAPGTVASGNGYGSPSAPGYVAPAAASGPGYTSPAGYPTAVAASRSAARRAHRAPTNVMGAAYGPAARRTRVSPMEVAVERPVASRPCVWRKTTVAAAYYRPSYRVGTSYVSGSHPIHHKKCVKK